MRGASLGHASRLMTRVVAGLLVVLFLVERSTVVSAQRLQQGCYDAFPVSCEPPLPDDSSDDPSTLDAEAVCTRLAAEVFPSTAILLNRNEHADFLNSIEQGDEFCAEIRRTYHLCFWCGSEALFSVCQAEAFWDNCGGKPTRQQVLASDAYPAFETEQDIEATCDKLEASYGVNLFDSGGGMPTTIELCIQQNQVKHLCPGHCEGGCFDGPDGSPPTCEPYQGDFDPDLEEWRVCDFIHYDILFFMPNLASMMDISQQTDYLRAIGGNTTMCQYAQQSYSQCFWCGSVDDRCFNDNNPPSCTQPDGVQAGEKWAASRDICNALFSPLSSNFGNSLELYDTSLHQDVLLFRDNTSFCEQAQYYYHECMWCHPQTHNDEFFCVPNAWCNSNTSVPDDYILPPGFQELNMTISGLSVSVYCLDRVWLRERFNLQVSHFSRPRNSVKKLTSYGKAAGRILSCFQNVTRISTFISIVLSYVALKQRW